MPSRKRRTRWWIKRAAQAALLVATIIAAVYAGRFAVTAYKTAVAFYEISRMLYERNLITKVAQNHRGDKITVTVNVGETPLSILVTLTRPGHWFSTTLVDAQSDDLSVGAKWLDENTAEIQLDLGPKVRIDTPIKNVGAIGIQYRLGGPGAVADPGIDPIQSCPSPYPYPSSFWHCEKAP